MFRNAHYHAHLVFDQQNRQMKSVPYKVDQIHQLNGLLRVHARCGLVEQQELQEQNKAIGDARREVVTVPEGELVDWTVTETGEDGTLHMEVTIRAKRALTYAEARDFQENVAAELGRTVALTLGMVPAARLQAYVERWDQRVPSREPTRPEEGPTAAEIEQLEALGYVQ